MNIYQAKIVFSKKCIYFIFRAQKYIYKEKNLSLWSDLIIVQKTAGGKIGNNISGYITKFIKL